MSIITTTKTIEVEQTICDFGTKCDENVIGKCFDCTKDFCKKHGSNEFIYNLQFSFSVCKNHFSKTAKKILEAFRLQKPYIVKWDADTASIQNSNNSDFRVFYGY